MILHAFLAHGYEREQELCSSIVGYCESCVMQITTRMRMLESRGELRAPFGTSGKYRRLIEHASSTLNSLFAIFFLFFELREFGLIIIKRWSRENRWKAGALFDGKFIFWYDCRASITFNFQLKNVRSTRNKSRCNHVTIKNRLDGTALSRDGIHS